MGSLSSMCRDLEQDRLDQNQNSTITRTEAPVFWDAIDTRPKVRVDQITEAVIDDLRSRSTRGIKKYNTTLCENNKDDFMNHLYEELLDAAQYVKKEMSLIPTLKELIYKYPNDQELGSKIREMFSNG